MYLRERFRVRFAANLDRCLKKRRVTITAAAVLGQMSRRTLHKVLGGEIALGLDALELISCCLGFSAGILVDEDLDFQSGAPPPATQLRRVLAGNIRRSERAGPLTVAEIADRAGWARTTLYDVLACRVSTATDRLPALANALRTTTRSLVEAPAPAPLRKSAGARKSSGIVPHSAHRLT